MPKKCQQFYCTKFAQTSFSNMFFLGLLHFIFASECVYTYIKINQSSTYKHRHRYIHRQYCALYLKCLWWESIYVFSLHSCSWNRLFLDFRYQKILEVKVKRELKIDWGAQHIPDLCVTCELGPVFWMFLNKVNIQINNVQ